MMMQKDTEVALSTLPTARTKFKIPIITMVDLARHKETGSPRSHQKSRKVRP